MMPADQIPAEQRQALIQQLLIQLTQTQSALLSLLWMAPGAASSATAPPHSPEMATTGPAPVAVDRLSPHLRPSDSDAEAP